MFRTHITRQGLYKSGSRGVFLVSSLMLDFQILFSNKFTYCRRFPAFNYRSGLAVYLLNAQ